MKMNEPAMNRRMNNCMEVCSISWEVTQLTRNEDIKDVKTIQVNGSYLAYYSVTFLVETIWLPVAQWTKEIIGNEGTDMSGWQEDNGTFLTPNNVQPTLVLR